MATSSDLIDSINLDTAQNGWLRKHGMGIFVFRHLRSWFYKRPEPRVVSKPSHYRFLVFQGSTAGKHKHKTAAMVVTQKVKLLFRSKFYLFPCKFSYLQNRTETFIGWLISFPFLLLLNISFFEYYSAWLYIIMVCFNAWIFKLNAWIIKCVACWWLIVICLFIS